MEPKKKKLDDDFHLASALDFRDEDLQQLFNKKFTYSKDSFWTLENTSLLKKLATESEAPCGKVSQMLMQDAGKAQDCKGFFVREEVMALSVWCEKPGKLSATDFLLHCDRGDADQPCASTVAAKKTSDGMPSGNDAPNTVKVADGQLNQVTQCGGLDPLCTSSGDAHRQLQFVLAKTWQCDELMQMKHELNALKDQLSDKEMVSWHQHTSFTNPAGKVVSEMKRRYHVELCTQAWCKVHEILATCDILPPSLWSQTPTNLHSVHLCEAPGAFITSLNHFLASRGYKGRWSWLGTTLNPYYEGNDAGQMIDDDRFIRTTYKNWFFGKDNSGDLMSMENLELLMDRVKARDIQLVTADGSVDCQENPAEQEILVSRLHHCEVLTACLLLAPGGALVIKLFTMFEASSITLLYFLNCSFSKVTVCKPATSKSGNSEVYVVCMGYTAPIPQETLMSVFSAVVSSDQLDIVLLEKHDIPQSFLSEHTQCCCYFQDLQSQTISQNISLYKRVGEDEQKRLTCRQDLCVEHYIRVCGLQQIANQSRIVPFGSKNYSRFFMVRPKFNNKSWSQRTPMEISNSSSAGTWLLPPGRFHGTFLERQQQHSLTWSQLLSQIPDYIVDEGSCVTIQCQHSLREEEYSEWRPLMGRPLHFVSSSQFCDAKLLADMKQLSQHSQLNSHQQQALVDYAKHMLSEATSLLRGNHFCGHHHNTSAFSEIFHLALEGSVTLSCQPDAPDLLMVSLKSMHGLSQLGDRQVPVGLVIDLTWPSWSEFEEIWCQKRFLDMVLAVCSYLPEGSSVVLLAPVSLTRLSAGLLYIFAGLFRETSNCCIGASVFLHQLFFFQHLQVPSYSLLKWLEGLRQAMVISCSNTHTEQSHKRMSVDGDRNVVEGMGERTTGACSVCGEQRNTSSLVSTERMCEVTDGERFNAADASQAKHALQDVEKLLGNCEGCDTENAEDHKGNRASLAICNVATSHICLKSSVSSHTCVNCDKTQSEQVTLKSQAAESPKNFSPAPKSRKCVSGRVLCKHENKKSSADFLSRSPQKCAQNDVGGGGSDCGDDGCTDCRCSSGGCRSTRRRVSGKVPLEVVPILQILNDAVFTRFLQMCNKSCLGSFVNTVKAAEQSLLHSDNGNR